MLECYEDGRLIGRVGLSLHLMRRYTYKSIESMPAKIDESIQKLIKPVIQLCWMWRERCLEPWDEHASRIRLSQ